jgi:hypothetical protein
MLKRAGWLSVAAVAGVVVLTGATCSTVPGGGNGSLRLEVTDKPFPFDFITSAVVTLTRVEVHQVAAAASGDEETANAVDPAGQAADVSADEDTEGDGAWITVFEDSAGKDFDLAELRNGRTDLLADAEIPAGTYNQLRLVVTGGEVTLTDGRTFPLTVPSGSTSGIKLHFTFEVTESETTQLLLDVDLSRAFQPIPGGHIDAPETIRQFHFTPSLAMRLIKVVEAGSISGVVTDSSQAPVPGAAVTAYKDETEVTSTATETDGSYKLVGLTTGTYRVTVSATGFADAEVAGIAVTAGQETANVNVILTPQQ